MGLEFLGSSATMLEYEQQTQSRCASSSPLVNEALQRKYWSGGKEREQQ
jgi:hypothetical protein